MKRLLIIAVLLSMIFGITAFQCGSTELTSARLYIQQENLDKAKEQLIKETQKNPKSDEGFYLLGYVYGQENDIKNMVESFEKSLKISDKFKQKITENRVFHWVENFNKGINLYNKGAKATDEETAQENYKKAIEKFDMAIIAEPDSDKAYRSKAFACINMGAPEDAIAPLEKVIEINPSGETYYHLGGIFHDKGFELKQKYEETKDEKYNTEAQNNFNKAIEVLEEGRKAFPGEGKILQLLSSAYIEAGKEAIAMDVFKNAVEVEPDNKLYRYNYGVLLLGVKKFQEAEVQFKKAVDLDPEYLNALFNLSVTYIKWGSLMRQEAEEQQTGSEEYKEVFEKAVPYLERYKEIEPEEVSIYNQLVIVYSNLNMKEKANEAFKKVQELGN